MTPPLCPSLLTHPSSWSHLVPRSFQLLPTQKLCMAGLILSIILRFPCSCAVAQFLIASSSLLRVSVMYTTISFSTAHFIWNAAQKTIGVTIRSFHDILLWLMVIFHSNDFNSCSAPGQTPRSAVRFTEIGRERPVLQHPQWQEHPEHRSLYFWQNILLTKYPFPMWLIPISVNQTDIKATSSPFLKDISRASQ